MTQDIPTLKVMRNQLLFDQGTYGHSIQQTVADWEPVRIKESQVVACDLSYMLKVTATRKMDSSLLSDLQRAGEASGGNEKTEELPLCSRKECFSNSSCPVTEWAASHSCNGNHDLL